MLQNQLLLQKCIVLTLHHPPTHHHHHPMLCVQALHFIQIIHSGRFQLFDYGSPAENMGE